MSSNLYFSSAIPSTHALNKSKFNGEDEDTNTVKIFGKLHEKLTDNGNHKYMLFCTGDTFNNTNEQYFSCFFFSKKKEKRVTVYASLQIMLTVATTFCLCMICCYSFYRSMMSRNEYAERNIFIQTMWCLYYLFFIILIVAVGSATTREVCVVCVCQLTFTHNTWIDL